MLRMCLTMNRRHQQPPEPRDASGHPGEHPAGDKDCFTVNSVYMQRLHATAAADLLGPGDALQPRALLARLLMLPHPDERQEPCCQHSRVGKFRGSFL